MYIYQPDRALLKSQIQTAIHYLFGRVLNIGSGPVERYKLPDSVTGYVRMDVVPGDNVDVIGRAEAIPFPDASFDSILCTQVFEHIEEPEMAAGEVARVIKPGGFLLITVPQWNELHEEPHDYWRYTRYGLAALFLRNGFELVSMEARGGYFVTRAQMRMRYLIDRWTLHRRPLLGRIVSKLFSLTGRIALWRDRRDTSDANRKHTLGWCAVFRKL